jgi:hypothetical protein
MPDLTTEYAWACKTNEQWSTTVLSSDGQTTYTVRWQRQYDPNRMTEYDYSCTCKGFAHRGTCKHVKAASATDLSDVKGPGDRCAWDGRFEVPELADPANPVCPLCAGPVFSYAYGA